MKDLRRFRRLPLLLAPTFTAGVAPAGAGNTIQDVTDVRGLPDHSAEERAS
ncbi:hypothetical protein [Arthrobacter sp. B0490]|uniref:hypothetical protein n=1 Tax=Arthrobacter sp. B0490 TaxID=2058891 RepID=UPI0015E32F50|nr:hypothetical protein [Arthrobacter sp. B0490]